MSHSRLWSTYEGKPAGTDNASAGDDEIRNHKVDVRERMAIDHEWNVSTTVDGRHLQCTLKAQDDLTGTANYGKLYTKTVGDHVELMYVDDDGTPTQLTSNGTLLDTVLAKTGDWILSTVTTARTGWTNVSATYADKFMRISETPLTTGGADTHDHGAATGSHTLLTAEMPAHTHTYTLRASVGSRAGDYDGTVWEGSGTDNGTSGSTGGGGGHTHEVASADNIPAYVQVVVFQKD